MKELIFGVTAVLCLAATLVFAFVLRDTPTALVMATGGELCVMTGLWRQS